MNATEARNIAEEAEFNKDNLNLLKEANKFFNSQDFNVYIKHIYEKVDQQAKVGKYLAIVKLDQIEKENAKLFNLLIDKSPLSKNKVEKLVMAIKAEGYVIKTDYDYYGSNTFGNCVRVSWKHVENITCRARHTYDITESYHANNRLLDKNLNEEEAEQFVSSEDYVLYTNYIDKQIEAKAKSGEYHTEIEIEFFNELSPDWHQKVENHNKQLSINKQDKLIEYLKKKGFGAILHYDISSKEKAGWVIKVEW